MNITSRDVLSFGSGVAVAAATFLWLQQSSDASWGHAKPSSKTPALVVDKLPVTTKPSDTEDGKKCEPEVPAIKITTRTRSKTRKKHSSSRTGRAKPCTANDGRSIELNSHARQWCAEKVNGMLPIALTYLDQFMAYQCSSFLMDLRLFPNAKEITESMACLSAVDKHFKHLFKFQSSDVLCVCVGDGATPRTACLAAMRTKWRRCIAIDPLLVESESGYQKIKVQQVKNIQRLEWFGEKIQDITIDVSEEEKHVVIILPHCHVVPDTVVASFRLKEGQHATFSVVQMPCCHWVWHNQICGVTCDEEYMDGGVGSTARTMRVWKDVSQQLIQKKAVQIGNVFV
jgi:hypothetical protein